MTPNRDTTQKSEYWPPDSERRRLTRAARQLADLLTEAIPLAKLLDAPSTPHLWRLAVREFVGREQYFELTNILDQMCSMAAWEIGHAKNTARKRTRSRGTATGGTPSRSSRRDT